MNENEKEREDHLKDFLSGDSSEKPKEKEENIEYIGNNVKKKVDYIEATSDWVEVPTHDLPFGKFYKVGTRIYVRPAKTAEIESFSIVNEKNPYDVQLKLNEMLSACTKVVFIDGSTGSYRDLQNGDRDTLCMHMSKIASKHNKGLVKKETCECKELCEIEITPKNYVWPEEDPKIKPFFNSESRVYEFKLKDGQLVKLAPPTIGLTEDINNYMFYITTKSEGKITPNVSLMQCLPYMKQGNGVKNLSIEKLDQEEFNFKMLNRELFMFIFDAVDKMNFGIEKIKGRCPKCSQEVYSDYTFPEGPRALFIVPNAFDAFIGQPT